MIGSLLARFATPLLIAGLVASSGALIVNGIKLHRAERAVQKAEKAKVAAELAFDELVRDYNEQARMADARERIKEQQHAEATIRIANELGAKLADKDRSLRAALDGLRYAEEGARRRALLPREAAPAACRDHAASPTQLAVQDAEVALGIAADGDRAAVRLEACQQYVKQVVSISREEAGKADVE